LAVGALNYYDGVRNREFKTLANLRQATIYRSLDTLRLHTSLKKVAKYSQHKIFLLASHDDESIGFVKNEKKIIAVFHVIGLFIPKIII
jgi:Fe2+ or Zn2+ uptake regulation protein